MTSSRDMSVDDLISKNKTYAGDRSRSSSGSGSARRFVKPKPIRASPYTMPPRMAAEEMIMMPRSGGYNGDSEAKLYISNLDYGVSSTDIQLLFSDVGELRSQSVHYDRSGRSKGTAEVVFARQIDALAAMKKYNNLPLDGKPMIIELVGPDSFTATSNMGKPNDVFKRLSYGGAQESSGGQGHGGACGRNFSKTQRQGRHNAEKPTKEELDADMERYHLAAIDLKKHL